MGDEVENPGNISAQTHCSDHVSQLADRRIGHHPFNVPLRNGNRGSEQCRRKSNTGGKDNLSITLTDGGSSTGKTTWTNHAFTGATYTTSVDVYDSLGVKHTVSLRFTKQGDNTWDMNASMDTSDGTISTSKISGITFNSDGTFSASGSTTLAFEFSGISGTQSVIFSLGTSSKSDGLTQYGGTSTAAATSQDGY